MDIWNADKLALFLIFFVLGFISIKVYDLLVPGETRDFTKSLLEAVSYSTLNFAALFWLIATIQTGDFYQRHFILYSLSVAAIMVVVPACWPLVFLGVSAWRPIGKHIVHPIQKPWDYVFGKHEPFWILVHLKNGEKIGGRFGLGSFASSNPADEQIYLEEIWVLDDDDRFVVPVEDSRGIIIMNNEIRAVEFFDENGAWEVKMAESKTSQVIAKVEKRGAQTYRGIAMDGYQPSRALTSTPPRGRSTVPVPAPPAPAKKAAGN